MPNRDQADRDSVPEMSPRQLADTMKDSSQLVLLDVREAYELARARIADPRVRLAPLSDLAQRQEEALPSELADRERPVVVFCHVGIRSAQVTLWLRALGWKEVYSLAGGIDAYAVEIDPTIERY